MIFLESYKKHRSNNASVAQLVERDICNVDVGGSSPLGGLIFNERFVMKYTYDTIMFYCPICEKKNNVQVSHKNAVDDYFHQKNIPIQLAIEIKPQTQDCVGCNRPLQLNLENIPVRQYNLSVKLDCSNQRPGMESWYEDAIPKAIDEYDI